MANLTLTVFTHPACSGCPEAVREAWELAEERPELELRTVTLAEAPNFALMAAATAPPSFCRAPAKSCGAGTV